jgi:hypothetical protein
MFEEIIVMLRDIQRARDDPEQATLLALSRVRVGDHLIPPPTVRALRAAGLGGAKRSDLMSLESSRAGLGGARLSDLDDLGKESDEK